ncbi:ABC transporter substrate-binding protein [Caballeronia sp. LjRoot34]|uniref:ABC transporter substrate-binding protein n=1 Tax=Caballeronia sp. LjRoot34 TaxID=3342325 RepID=UPI003ECC76CD
MSPRSISSAATLLLALLGFAATAAQADDKSPVLVGFIIAQSGSPFAVTDPGRVATIAAQAVNDQGGINGRKLVVEICDTKGQPAASLACARRLADKGAITLIGGRSANGVDKILRAKNMAAWFPMGSDPSDVRNPLSFITALNGAGAAQGTYLGAKTLWRQTRCLRVHARQHDLSEHRQIRLRAGRRDGCDDHRSAAFDD